MLDILIRNGTVFDGTGAPGFTAGVGVSGDTIVLVGQADADAKQVIDASGKAVTPGFIDLHTHSDVSFLVDPLADSKLRQGVTLELFGNCGMSICAPLTGMAKESLTAWSSRYGVDLKTGWTDFAGYLSALEKARSPINIATQVGHGQVRLAVIGMDARAPTPEELDRMVSLVAESLDAGALGFSTGLWYAPGSYSLTDEVVALAQPAADRGLLYSSHVRSEGDDACGLFVAHAEAVEIGRRTGARIQISHVKALSPGLWGRGGELIEGIERARREGVDVAGDQYPYTWSSTSISGALFPRWALAGGRAETLKRLADADMRERVKHGIAGFFPRYHGPDGCTLGTFAGERRYEGMNLVEIAGEMRCPPEEAAARLYQKSEGSMVLHSIEEVDLYEIARSGNIAVASDGMSLRTTGPLSAGKPHPRSYGTNARFLDHMVREKKLEPFAEAIRKMTALPAQRLGLARRGRLAPGQIADVLVFDPAQVREHATYAGPHQYATGMDWVLVNGKPALADGKPTGATPGRVLRSKAD